MPRETCFKMWDLLAPILANLWMFQSPQYNSYERADKSLKKKIDEAITLDYEIRPEFIKKAYNEV